ncbi:hypothetical protein JY651_02455 [Pyxidicoccus parkwayensis]|uniref:Lipoprotein n=1 Tax=Pyxidicoccus parkwayensis TaxID=2813578 RepID=A0ABX7NY77_9BACT|nr:hypothetical protein [Pyxidicoccus parkwaysis]QSQ23865.1 hypothetical protein JY651_02455 [Pyxidicoccus parkwaysis]
MKMKHIVISALLALGLTSCVDSTPSLQIGSASAQGADCSIGTTGPALLRGSLDLSLRPGGGFPLALAIITNLDVPVVAVGDQPVSGDPDLSTIYVTNLVLSYSSPTAGLTFSEPKANVRVFGAVDADGNLLVNLLTPDVIQDVGDFVAGGDSAEVLVTLKLKAQRASGDELESNEIVFPVLVYASGFTCPTGTKRTVSDDPCPQEGLNGVLPACEAVTP